MKNCWNLMVSVVKKGKWKLPGMWRKRRQKKLNLNYEHSKKSSSSCWISTKSKTLKNTCLLICVTDWVLETFEKVFFLYRIIFFENSAFVVKKTLCILKKLKKKLDKSEIAYKAVFKVAGFIVNRWLLVHSKFDLFQLRHFCCFEL